MIYNTSSKVFMIYLLIFSDQDIFIAIFRRSSHLFYIWFGYF